MVRISADDGDFIGPIDAPRAADVLAGRLRHRILGGSLVPGDVLPSERGLMVDTQLGRATVREALRLLEAEGLITPRLGRYGGWTVRTPDRAVISRSIDGFIRGMGVLFADVLATREAIEPSCAALAAEHRTEDDLSTLERHGQHLVRSIRDLPEFLRVNVDWHLAVVDATHNELLIAIMSALADAIHEGTDIKKFHSIKVRRAAIGDHDAVMEAIRDGDPDAARRRMLRHVHAFREQVTEHASRHQTSTA